MDISWLVVKILLIIVLFFGAIALGRFTFQYMGWHWASIKKPLFISLISLASIAALFGLYAFIYFEFFEPTTNTPWELPELGKDWIPSH
jgi:multisubunit Na+/H+ antiporter MnhG subunit